ncbi:MAG: hypothetical protein GY788_00765 [bacterium]|nr:hypothetical protein [bacterium]
MFAGEFAENLGLDILSRVVVRADLDFVTFSSRDRVNGLTKEVKALVIQVVPQPPVGVALEFLTVDPAGR